MPCLRSGAVFPSHASSRTWDELMPEIVASNVSVQRAALAYMGSGASAAALRRVSSGPASPLGGRPEVPRVRRDADTFAPLPRAPAAPPQRRAWASSASAASERTRVGSKQELESALASAQAALQAATERVAALETANEILRSQVAFLGASGEDSKNFIVSSK